MIAGGGEKEDAWDEAKDSAGAAAAEADPASSVGWRNVFAFAMNAFTCVRKARKSFRWASACFLCASTSVSSSLIFAFSSSFSAASSSGREPPRASRSSSAAASVADCCDAAAAASPPAAPPAGAAPATPRVRDGSDAPRRLDGWLRSVSMWLSVKRC
jgi:hypothetical protein